MKNKFAIDYFEKIDFLEFLTDKEKKFLAECVKIKTFEPGDFLFKEGMPRNFAYIMSDGKLEIFKQDAFGQEKFVKFFDKNNLIGEGALIGDLPHTTSARIIDKSIVLVLSNNDAASFLSNYPVTGSKILMHVSRIISRKMRMTSVKATNIASQYFSGSTRQEHDFLGNREIPLDYYFGIQTFRALENFYISGISISNYPEFVKALAMIKIAAAKANNELGLLPDAIKDAIVLACHEIIADKHISDFVVDLIQGGAGTSTNMNANEVIANRALELMGHKKGEYQYCHPNDHVNLSQSTNDVYPSALKLAFIDSNSKMMKVLQELIQSLRKKGVEFKKIIKMGRTQLQDAVPVTLGQEFEAYAVALELEVERFEIASKLLLRLNLGGTAIGTGINTVQGYREKAIRHLQDVSGLDVILDPDLIAATQDTGSFVTYSSVLKRLAIKLSKICNDLRLLSSGPRTGLNEINLPKMQPGSSIMPGKVNPVIPEVVNQVAYKVIGNDLTITMASEAGQLELNVMEPVIAQSIFESVEMLKNSMTTLKLRCIDGITANEAHCRAQVESSIALVTALSPVLGYEVCGKLATEALGTGKSIAELVIEKELLSKEETKKLLAPENMLQPSSK